MPYTPTPVELAEALNDAAGLKLRRVKHITGRAVVVTLEWQGQELQFQATITDVLSGELPARPRKRNEHAHYGRSRARYYEQALTEADCRRLDLPLYYSEEWLRREKERLGGFAGITREHGYTSSTLSYAAQQFGWAADRPDHSAVRAQVMAEWQAGAVSKSALARKYGVSPASVSAWTKG